MSIFDIDQHIYNDHPITVDIAKELGFTPLGKDRVRKLFRYHMIEMYSLSGNEGPWELSVFDDWNNTAVIELKVVKDVETLKLLMLKVEKMDQIKIEIKNIEEYEEM